MIKNQLKSVLRTLRSQKGYAILNIGGLSVGIALSILALLYVQHEYNFDSGLSKADRIYRVVQDINIPSYQGFNAKVAPGLARSLSENFPEVLLATRISNGAKKTLAYGDRTFKTNNLNAGDGQHFVVDRSIVELFDIQIIGGDPDEPFPADNSFLISESMAEKIFGEDNPIGRPITLTGPWLGSHENVVTAEARDMPANSHFQFDLLDPIDEVPDPGQSYNAQRQSGVYTYILLPEAYPPERLEEKFPAFVDRVLGPEVETFWGGSWENIKANGGGWTLHLQGLTDVHLDARYGESLGRRGSRTSMGFFSIVAIFILVLACVNFMNLATARSSRRIKEVGIRKVVGSSRTQLIHQFLLESILISLFSLLVACALVLLMLPAFNTFLGTEVAFHLLENVYLLPGLVVLALTVGVLAGSYPAFFLSGFRPVELFRGARRNGTRGVSLRDGLVVFQFIITVLLIVATTVVYNQLSFMRDKDPGFNDDQVIVVQDVRDTFGRSEGPRYQRLVEERGYSTDDYWNMNRSQMNELTNGEDGIGRFNQNAARRARVFQQQLLKIPAIRSVSLSDAIPGRVDDWSHLERSDLPERGAQEIRISHIDSNIVETLQLELVAGRDLRSDDSMGSYLSNETAAHMFGPGFPLGSNGMELLVKAGYEAPAWTNGPIVGVVKDFHSFDMRSQVQPRFFRLMPRHRPIDNMIIRFQSTDLQATLASIERTWGEFITDEPLNYTFLDQDFARLFEAEKRLAKAFGFFATLAIIIACLGLFGLAAFMAEVRTKEIGVRKTLGASVQNIVQLMSSHFLWLLLIGNIVAWPIGYIVMNKWLEDFAFRIDIGLGTFLLTGAVALLLVIISVGGQALRASLANPIDSLRYE